MCQALLARSKQLESELIPGRLRIVTVVLPLADLFLSDQTGIQRGDRFGRIRWHPTTGQVAADSRRYINQLPFRLLVNLDSRGCHLASDLPPARLVDLPGPTAGA